MGMEDWGSSEDGDAAKVLPLAILVGMQADSVANLDPSRFPCFCRNLGNLDVAEREGEGDGVCRCCLVDIKIKKTRKNNNLGLAGSST